MTPRNVPPVTSVAPGTRTLSDTQVASVADRVGGEGWAMLPGVLDAERCATIDEDLHRLERSLGIVPADNLFAASLLSPSTATTS